MPWLATMQLASPALQPGPDSKGALNRTGARIELVPLACLGNTHGQGGPHPSGMRRHFKTMPASAIHTLPRI